MREMKKRGFSMLLVCLLAFASVLPVSAQSNGNVQPSYIEVEREDVSLREALQDPTFNRSYKNVAEEITTRATSWKVWGESEHRTSDNTARPIGYSQHISNGKVLSTYHYTRTYLDSGIGGKKGDSGRVWGTYTVKAVGKYCSMDVWDTSIHKVKYGTES